MNETFVQAAPPLRNRYRADPALRQAAERLLPGDLLPAAEAELDALGELARTELAALGERAEANPPRHVPYDAWGRRIDRIEVDPAWERLVELASEHGLVATAYEERYGAAARIVQAGLLQLFDPVTATALCPVGMTDAAARALLNHDEELAGTYVPRLTARRGAWTSGQWMTEQAGGSDVGTNATVARDAGGGWWTLHGTKWFTSATTADIALVLARPEGAAAGSAGLSLFLLELRAGGGWNGLRVRRLKDKLGTRGLPTAEIELDGARARPVGGTGRGVAKVADMLNVARLGAAASSVAHTGHALTLARDYADLRVVFGKPLSSQPVHRRWIAQIAACYEAMVALVFRAAELVGASEHGADPALARVVVPLTKLACARQAVWACSHLLESFGGAGYLEDTGLPRVLRNVHVHCIWEGTTSVMALDVVRALREATTAAAVLDDLERLVEGTDHPAISAVARRVLRARAELGDLLAGDTTDARRLAWGLARTYQAALLCEAGAWALDKQGDARVASAATLLATQPLLDAAPGIGDDELAALAFPAGSGTGLAPAG